MCGFRWQHSGIASFPLKSTFVFRGRHTSLLAVRRSSRRGVRPSPGLDRPRIALPIRVAPASAPRPAARPSGSHPCPRKRIETHAAAERPKPRPLRHAQAAGTRLRLGRARNGDPREHDFCAPDHPDSPARQATRANLSRLYSANPEDYLSELGSISLVRGLSPPEA